MCVCVSLCVCGVCGGAGWAYWPRLTLLPTDKGFFNCAGFLALMDIYWQKAQNQKCELRAAF